MIAALKRRRDHWNDRALRYATDAERVDQTARSQRARFSTVDPLLFPGCSILDVGCGVGDLYGYLVDRGARFAYLGVDLAPRMIERAREKYPAGCFEVDDILEWEARPRFDLVVGISIHSDPVPRASEILYRILGQQFALSKVAAHASLLSAYYPHNRDEVCCFWPDDVLSMGVRLTPWVSLRHDYLPHDFAVTLRREATT